MSKTNVLLPPIDMEDERAHRVKISQFLRTVPRTTHASNFPVAGAAPRDRFAQGDIVWNSAPVANGWIGWVCVVSGDFSASSASDRPTFKTFGRIAP